MAPKVKVTREDIVKAAIELVRVHGERAINAREIAGALNCSTQPIFTNFATMGDLRIAVIDAAMVLSDQYMKTEVESGRYPTYKATGMAYIRFAKEEKELFKLLYMRDRTEEQVADDKELSDGMMEIIRKHTGLDEERAKMFHLEMWAVVHGIATMFITGYVKLEWELVSRMITDVYQGLKKQYGGE